MIAIVSGTRRRGSRSLQVAHYLKGLYEEMGVEARVLDLVELPAEAFEPEAFEETPERVRTGFIEPYMAAAGVHFVVAEYNGSFPGVLKHFVDLLPFPEAFENRRFAFLGLSAGRGGGTRAVEQLQTIFAYRNAHLFNRRVFIDSARTSWGQDGRPAGAELATRLRQQAEGFVSFTGSP